MGKQYTENERGRKGDEKEESSTHLAKEENAWWWEKGRLEKTMVQLAPWSVSIFSVEKGVVLGCNFSLSDPSFRMI